MKRGSILIAVLFAILFFKSPVALAAPEDEDLPGDTSFEVGS